MRTAKARVVVVAFMLLLPFADPGLSAPATVVVPGKAMGPIRIGMRLDDAGKLMRAFGPVVGDSDSDGRSVCTTSGIRVCAYDFWHWRDRSKRPRAVKTPGRVVAISTDDGKFRTVGDIGVGSSFEDFLRAYWPGKPEELVLYGWYIPVPTKELSARGLLKPGVSYAVVYGRNVGGVIVLVRWVDGQKPPSIPKNPSRATVVNLTVAPPQVKP